jgi:hypothetical protein
MLIGVNFNCAHLERGYTPAQILLAIQSGP